MNSDDSALVAAITEQALPLSGTDRDFDAIIEAARGKSLVLIGESTHGTSEFYRARERLTRRLISELGFAGVAVEADWPDAFAINRHVWNLQPDQPEQQVLAAFERFPAWLWANREVLEFVRWLARFNRTPARADAGLRPVGFYGLDLYSLRSSIRAVITYLERVDPPAAVRARERYSCMDHFLQDPQLYGQKADSGFSRSCEQALAEQLQDMQTRALQRLEGLGLLADEHRFHVEQNARLVRNAGEYYRAMFRGRPGSWNLRENHMFETLQALRDHLSHQLGEPAALVVWAHNSHVGNAEATGMVERREASLGQMARQVYGDKALLVGFSTASGEVTAAAHWDGPAETMALNPPLPGSHEALFQQVPQEAFLLDLRNGTLAAQLGEPRVQRSVGVVYRPESERESHYLSSRLPQQFDFLLHFQRTHGIEPLIERTPASGELGATWPSGL